MELRGYVPYPRVCMGPNKCAGGCRAWGTALGDCIGWSVVFSMLPGDSFWEVERPELGSEIAMEWAAKGLGVELTPYPLLAYTYPEGLSSPLWSTTSACSLWLGGKHWETSSISASLCLKLSAKMKTATSFPTADEISDVLNSFQLSPEQLSGFFNKYTDTPTKKT